MEEFAVPSCRNVHVTLFIRPENAPVSRQLISLDVNKRFACNSVTTTYPDQDGVSPPTSDKRRSSRKFSTFSIFDDSAVICDEAAGVPGPGFAFVTRLWCYERTSDIVGGEWGLGVHFSCGFELRCRQRRF